MKQSFLKITTAIMLATTLLSGCGTRQDENLSIEVEATDETTSEYTLAKVQQGTVVSEVVINCSYSPKEKLDCCFQGEQKLIKEILVEKGDLVTKGQVLARLDMGDLDTLIKEEQHQVEMAQLELAQAQELKKIDLDMLSQEYNYVKKEERDYDTYNENRKTITKEYDNQITDCSDRIAIHQMRLEEYQNEIEEGTLRAPDDGVVIGSRSNLVGAYSKPDEMVVNIIRNDDLTFRSDELEKAQYLEEGRTYQMIVGKGENEQYIDVIPSDKSEWEEAMYFEIQVPDLQMDSGTKGVIWIELDKKQDVLYVPNSAIHQSGDKYYVYTVSDEGLREIQYISVGLSGRDNTEVKNGLSLGQSVVTD